MKVQRVLRVLVESEPSPFFEQVVVEGEGPRYRLAKSPGLVLGLAAGDLFELGDDGKPRVIERGRNVCVQVFSEDAKRLEMRLTPQFARIGGWLDGSTAKNLVYTVPVSAGFPAIESVLAGLDSTVEWLYGNVYDDVDGVTPLNWWKE